MTFEEMKTAIENGTMIKHDGSVDYVPIVLFIKGGGEWWTSYDMGSCHEDWHRIKDCALVRGNKQGGLKK